MPSLGRRSGYITILVLCGVMMFMAPRSTQAIVELNLDKLIPVKGSACSKDTDTCKPVNIAVFLANADKYFGAWHPEGEEVACNENCKRLTQKGFCCGSEGVDAEAAIKKGLCPDKNYFVAEAPGLTYTNACADMVYCCAGPDAGMTLFNDWWAVALVDESNNRLCLNNDKKYDYYNVSVIDALKLATDLKIACEDNGACCDKMTREPKKNTNGYFDFTNFNCAAEDGDYVRASANAIDGKRVDADKDGWVDEPEAKRACASEEAGFCCNGVSDAKMSKSACATTSGSSGYYFVSASDKDTFKAACQEYKWECKGTPADLRPAYTLGAFGAKLEEPVSIVDSDGKLITRDRACKLTPKSGICCYHHPLFLDRLQTGGLAPDADTCKTIATTFKATGSDKFYGATSAEYKTADTDSSGDVNENEAKAYCEGPLDGICCGTSKKSGITSGVTAASSTKCAEVVSKTEGINSIFIESADPRYKAVAGSDGIVQPTEANTFCRDGISAFDQVICCNDKTASCSNVSKSSTTTKTTYCGSGRQVDLVSAGNTPRLTAALEKCEETCGSTGEGFCCDLGKRAVKTGATVTRASCENDKSAISPQFIASSTAEFSQADKNGDGAVSNTEATNFCFGQSAAAKQTKQLWCCTPPVPESTFGGGLHFDNGDGSNQKQNQNPNQNQQFEDDDDDDSPTGSLLQASLYEVQVAGGGICSLEEELDPNDPDGQFNLRCPNNTISVIGNYAACESVCAQYDSGGGSGGGQSGGGGPGGASGGGAAIGGQSGGVGNATIGGRGGESGGAGGNRGNSGTGGGGTTGGTTTGGGGTTGGTTVSSSSSSSSSVVSEESSSSSSSEESSSSSSSEEPGSSSSSTCPEGTICVEDAQTQCINLGGTCTQTCGEAAESSSEASSVYSVGSSSTGSPVSSSSSSEYCLPSDEFDQMTANVLAGLDATMDAFWDEDRLREILWDVREQIVRGDDWFLSQELLERTLQIIVDQEDISDEHRAEWQAMIDNDDTSVYEFRDAVEIFLDEGGWDRLPDSVWTRVLERDRDAYFIADLVAYWRLAIDQDVHDVAAGQWRIIMAPDGLPDDTIDWLLYGDDNVSIYNFEPWESGIWRFSGPDFDQYAGTDDGVISILREFYSRSDQKHSVELGWRDIWYVSHSSPPICGSSSSSSSSEESCVSSADYEEVIDDIDNALGQTLDILQDKYRLQDAIWQVRWEVIRGNSLFHSDELARDALQIIVDQEDISDEQRAEWQIILNEGDGDDFRGAVDAFISGTEWDRLLDSVWSRLLEDSEHAYFIAQKVVLWRLIFDDDVRNVVRDAWGNTILSPDGLSEEDIGTITYFLNNVDYCATCGWNIPDFDLYAGSNDSILQTIWQFYSPESRRSGARGFWFALWVQFSSGGSVCEEISSTSSSLSSASSSVSSVIGSSSSSSATASSYSSSSSASSTSSYCETWSFGGFQPCSSSSLYSSASSAYSSSSSVVTGGCCCQMPVSSSSSSSVYSVLSSSSSSSAYSILSSSSSSDSSSYSSLSSSGSSSSSDVSIQGQLLGSLTSIGGDPVGVTAILGMTGIGIAGVQWRRRRR